jgi:hypothetical protein
MKEAIKRLVSIEESVDSVISLVREVIAMLENCSLDQETKDQLIKKIGRIGANGMCAKVFAGTSLRLLQKFENDFILPIIKDYTEGDK